MRRTRFLIFFFATAALLVASAWRFPFPMHGAPGVLRAVAADVLIFLAAAAWGRRLLHALALIHRSVTEELILSTLLGLLFLSVLGSALAGFGILYAWVLAVGFGLIFLTHWDHLEHFGRELSRSLRAKLPWGGGSEVLALVASGLGLLCALALCLAPVTFFDALNYHLVGVQTMVQSGRDLPQATNFMGWLPDMVQPLWAIAYLLSGQPVLQTASPALLNFGMALLLGLQLSEASSRWLSEERRWTAPALAWTQPMMVLIFGVFSPDGWMAVYAFASLQTYLAALEDDDPRRQRAWLCLTALLAGAACACKAVAGLHVIALVSFFCWDVWQRPLWRRWSLAALLAALLALPLLPWALRGFALRGQAIYPFGLRLFGRQWSPGPPGNYSAEMASYGGPWWHLPLDAFFEPGRLGGNGHLSPLVFAMLPALFFWTPGKALRRLRAYVVVGSIAWFFGPHVLRFMLYLLPALCLLTAAAALEMESWAHRSWIAPWRGVILACLFLGALQTLSITTSYFHPWDVAVGAQEAAEYLSIQGIPQAEATAWIRSRPGGARARLLVLGDPRIAYLPVGALSASVYEDHPFKAWAGRAKDPQDLGAIVRRKGYDFVLVNRANWALMENRNDDPIYWDRGDTATAACVYGWIQGLAEDKKRPQLSLSRGTAAVFDLR